MSTSAKPTPPMNGAIINGVTRRTLPESGAGERKTTVVPGERQGVSRIPNEHPDAQAARRDAQAWLEKRRKQRERSGR